MCVWGGNTHTMWAAPFASGRLLQLGLQTHQVVGARTGVAQDDLAALLTHLAIILVVCLVAFAILIPQHCNREGIERNAC